MSNCTLKLRNYGTLVGRILIGVLFLLAGISKVAGIEGTTMYINSSTSLPAAGLVAWLAAIIEIVCGAALIVGKKASKSALVLAVFTLLASFLFHGPGLWADAPMQQTMFMKNLAIIGGLLYIAAYGPGDGWSLANKKSAAMPSTPSGGM